VKKSARRRKQMPKAARDGKVKQLLAAAKTDPHKALQIALYGKDGEAVANRLSSREKPASFRPLNEAGLRQFIQDWLFIGESWTDPWLKEKRREDPESFALKQNDLEIETAQWFGMKISEGDWKYFRDFAAKLKEGVVFYQAATLQNRDPIHAKILGHRIYGTGVLKGAVRIGQSLLVARAFQRTTRPPVERIFSASQIPASIQRAGFVSQWLGSPR